MLIIHNKLAAKTILKLLLVSIPKTRMATELLTPISDRTKVGIEDANKKQTGINHNCIKLVKWIPNASNMNKYCKQKTIYRSKLNPKNFKVSISLNSKLSSF